MDPNLLLIGSIVGVLLLVVLPITIWGNGSGGVVPYRGNSQDDIRRAIYQGQLDYHTLWDRPLQPTNHRFNQPTTFKGDN